MNRVGFIISYYKKGAPHGPMLTCKMYANELAIKISGSTILIFVDMGEDIDAIKLEFKNFKVIKVVEVSARWPVLLRPIFNKNIRDEIKNLYKSSDYLYLLWFPPLIMAFSSKMLTKTMITMMDSQVKLIETTYQAKNLINVIKKYIKILIFRFIENRIIKYSPMVNYVSKNDLNYKNLECKNIVISKIPFDNFLNHKVQKSEQFIKRILIPRPDEFLLQKFIEEFRQISDIEILILLKEEIPFIQNYDNISHIKFIENYDNFYKLGSLVVLLDSGGAGMSNRSIVTSRHGLHFLGTYSSIRGHEFKFPNLIKISDNLSELAYDASVFMKLQNKTCFNTEILEEYLFSFKPDEAIRPIYKFMIENKLI